MYVGNSKKSCLSLQLKPIWISNTNMIALGNKAYYGGEARCEEQAGNVDDYDPSELVCGACSDVSRAQVHYIIHMALFTSSILHRSSSLQ